MLAAEPNITASPFQSLLHVDQSARARRARMRCCERLGIADAADRPTAILPLGYLKRLEVARALAFDPKLLLLDEPLAGLNYTEAARMADVIVELNREGRTILLVEHNLGEVTRIAQRLVVLNNGAVLATGNPAEVMRRRRRAHGLSRRRRRAACLNCGALLRLWPRHRGPGSEPRRARRRHHRAARPQRRRQDLGPSWALPAMSRSRPEISCSMGEASSACRRPSARSAASALPPRAAASFPI